MSETAAIVAAVILAALGVFQAFLAAGAPIGHFAWGGSHTILPTRLRIASAAAIVLYAVIALVILDRAELISVLPDDAARIATWVLAAYFVIGTVMNLASRSKPERFVMTPVALVLAVLTTMVAVGP